MNPAVGDLVVASDVDVDGNLSVAGTITWANPRYSDSITISCLKTDGNVQNGCGGPVEIGALADRVCFLSMFEVKSASGSDFATCDVTAQGGNWRIEARTDGGDVDVRCRARCIRF
jgi:hypothetical protein